MPKRAIVIQLSEQEQEALTQLTKRHRSEQHVASRARIILAASQGASNAQITRDLHINITHYNRTIAKPFKWTYTELYLDQGGI